MRTLLTMLVGLALGGCVAEAGEACDGFFKNQCRAPSSCVTGSEGSYCGVSCSTRALPEPGQDRYYCEDTSMEPVEVQYEGAAMGCYCLSKAANS